MKAAFKVLSMVFSLAGGIAARSVFKRVWKAVAGEKEPQPTSSDHTTRQVLAAAAMEGAVYGAAKAAIERRSAKNFDKLGTEPVVAAGER